MAICSKIPGILCFQHTEEAILLLPLSMLVEIVKNAVFSHNKKLPGILYTGYSIRPAEVGG